MNKQKFIINAIKNINIEFIKIKKTDEQNVCL